MLEIGLVIFVTSLLLGFFHYVPWRSILHKDLSRLCRYSLGVLALLVPISVYWLLLGHWMLVVQLWCVVLLSGSTVYGLHWMDMATDAYNRAEVAEEEGRQLRGRQTNERD